jgi:hypothetical protein
MRITRTDKGQLKVIKTGEGFLKAEVIFAAPCVLPYFSDGKEKHEAKLPEEIFRPETIESAKGAVVCDGHPAVNGSRILVTPENYFQYLKGNLSEPRADGYGAKGLVTIYDKTLINEILGKKKTQVSIGFTCDLEEKSGMFNGQKYDAIQRNILINHLAITDDARAGDATRLLIDSKQEESKMAEELKTDADAGKADVSDAQPAGKAVDAGKKIAGEAKTYVYKTLDGSKDLKIDSKEIFDELIELNKKLQADAKKKEKKEPDPEEEEETEEEDACGGGKKNDANSGFDALRSELVDMIDKKIKDAMPDMVEKKTQEKKDEMDKELSKKNEEVKETISLMRIANRIIPDLKTDSMNPRQIKIQIIQKGLPNTYRADMTDDQINANYEAALEVLKVKAIQFDGRSVLVDDGSLKAQLEENKIKRNNVWGK